MKSSRNPKILNYVIKNMLDPIFHLLDKLLAREEDENRYIEEVTSIENSQNEQVNTVVGEFTDRETLLIKTIATDKSLLTDMIHRKLLNPNVGHGEGEEDETPYEETPFITDKLLSDIGYGFVKDGMSVLLAGAINKGIALGSDTNITGEFTFYNPNEKTKFPSFTVNHILKLSTYFAFIGTNAGLVQYDITSGQYQVRSTSYGLNANVVKKIIPVKRKISEGIEGYLVATSKGISFSPTGDRWLNVKEDFKDSISCFSTSQKIEETYTEVFVGTNRGIYFFDVDDYITQETGKLILLEGVMETLPSTYINALAYNSLKDTLYVATDSGITVINNVISDIRKGKIASTLSSHQTYNSNHGISSSLCFDIAIMPNQKVVIATVNGITVTSDFVDFAYITKKVNESSSGLNSYMCSKIIRKNAASITVLHPIGLTEGIVL